MVVSGGFTSTLSPPCSTKLASAYGVRVSTSSRRGAGTNLTATSSVHLPATCERHSVYDSPNFPGRSEFVQSAQWPSRPPGRCSRWLGCILTGTSSRRAPTWTFSDTLSWTHGAHAFRFNGELRLNSSETGTDYGGLRIEELQRSRLSRRVTFTGTNDASGINDFTLVRRSNSERQSDNAGIARRPTRETRGL